MPFRRRALTGPCHPVAPLLVGLPWAPCWGRPCRSVLAGKPVDRGKRAALLSCVSEPALADPRRHRPCRDDISLRSVFDLVTFRTNVATSPVHIPWRRSLRLSSYVAMSHLTNRQIITRHPARWQIGTSHPAGPACGLQGGLLSEHPLTMGRLCVGGRRSSRLPIAIWQTTTSHGGNVATESGG